MLLAVVILLGLGVVYGGDAIARPLGQRFVAQRMATALGVDPDQLEVSFGSAPLPLQLLDGRIDSVDVRAPHLTLGPVTAQTSVHAEGVPLDAGSPTTILRIRVAIDQAQLSRIAATFGGGYVQSVTLDAPDVKAVGSVRVLGVAVPLGVAFEPGAVDGRISFTPTSFEVAGQTVTADQLRRGPVGGLASELLQTQTICIADHLPKDLTVTSVAVDGGQLVATGSGDGATLEQLGEKGSC